MTPLEPHTPSSSVRLVGVEGLRAIAASSIVVFHVWLYSSADGQVPWLEGSIGILFHSLGLGVTLFFALSGFLLYRPFVAAALRGQPAPSWRAYFRNRALRIIPAYWVILLIVALVLQSAIVGGDGEIQTGALTDPKALLAALTLTHTYDPDTLMAGIGPAWSLAIEAVYYLCVPLLGALAIVLAGRWSRGWLAACVPAVVMLAIGLSGKFAAGVVWPGAGPTDGWGATWHAVIERSFWAQADLFAFGMVVAVLSVMVADARLRLPRWWRAAVLAVAVPITLLAASRLGWAQLSYLPENTVVAAGLAALVAVVVLPDHDGGRGRAAGVLEWSPLVSIGIVSYSLFLWHEPLIHWLREHGMTMSGTAGLFVNLAVVATVAGVLSLITYWLVERPAQRRRAGASKGALLSGEQLGRGGLGPAVAPASRVED